MNFGQKLKSARMNMNLTQQKIADDFSSPDKQYQVGKIAIAIPIL